MKLSIVTTMYMSSRFLKEFHRRISAAAQKITDDYEIIMVNDGSPDNSLDMVLELQKDDDHLVVINLSRNFGHHAAIVAGLEQAKGDRVFLIDCDLEEQPEWISQFMDEIDENCCDVVYGAQEERVSSTVSNFFGSLFWKALNVMSNVHIPSNPMTCRLMTQDYVRALMSVEDRVLYLAGVFAWAGYTQAPLYLTKIPATGDHKSTYGLRKKLLHVVDSFTSFSIAPLTFIFSMGVMIFLASVCYGVVLIIQKTISPEAIVTGYASFMLAIAFFSGIIIISLGVIGLYVSKIFQEVKRRPLYIVKEIYQDQKNDK